MDVVVLTAGHGHKADALLIELLECPFAACTTFAVDTLLRDGKRWERKQERTVITMFL